MWAFFHSWRRKAGVVTLAMACALSVLWARSRFANDWVHVYVSQDWSFLLESSDDCILLQTSFDPHDPPMIPSDPICFGSYSNNPAETGVVLDPIELEGRVLPPMTIPYWIVILPLTLLSAYLFLWKPRKWQETFAQTTISNVNSN